jgi:adenosine kinase
MKIAISGSIAYDVITHYEGQFANDILADHLHKLNVSFYVPRMRREFGGCAGNIAYGLKLLGGHPVPVGTLGDDGVGYMERFAKLGIDTSGVKTLAGQFCAQAYIVTDAANNQITAFHPGAMSQAHMAPIPADADIKLGIVSPNGRDAMVQHAKAFADRGIEFIFDPGQAMPLFNGDDLLAFLKQATWATFNEYEANLAADKTGQGIAALSHHVKALIVTLGEDGCDIWREGVRTHIAPVAAKEVLDPTGCGDAFRAALLWGLSQGWTLERCCEFGNRLGAHKIAHLGGQNHSVSGLV